MSRKSKIDPVEKVKIIERVLADEISATEAARLIGVDRSSIRDWRNLYLSDGPSALMVQSNNKTYSKELKLQAVQEYLDGKSSQRDIVKKYHLRSSCQLRNWIKVYTTHGEIKSRTSGGGSYMRKARSTTPEERLAIVQDCLANDKNYGAMALKYQCSYQQVRNWVKRYEEMGSAGLEDRRGHRVGTMPSRTPEEEMRDRIAELERLNRDLQMENDLLKKVRELEMKDRYL
jgi:Transposase and inactivated derivatives